MCPCRRPLRLTESPEPTIDEPRRDGPHANEPRCCQPCVAALAAGAIMSASKHHRAHACALPDGRARRLPHQPDRSHNLARPSRWWLREDLISTVPWAARRVAAARHPGFVPLSCIHGNEPRTAGPTPSRITTSPLPRDFAADICTTFTRSTWRWPPTAADDPTSRPSNAGVSIQRAAPAASPPGEGRPGEPAAIRRRVENGRRSRGAKSPTCARHRPDETGWRRPV